MRISPLMGVVIGLLSLFIFIEWSHVLHHIREETPQSRTSSQLAFAHWLCRYGDIQWIPLAVMTVGKTTTISRKLVLSNINL